jgi:hypothetical protein
MRWVEAGICCDADPCETEDISDVGNGAWFGSLERRAKAAGWYVAARGELHLCPAHRHLREFYQEDRES